MKLTEEAAAERVKVIDYLRMRARVWSGETVRHMEATAGVVGSQIDLLATEIREGAHLIEREPLGDEDYPKE